MQDDRFSICIFTKYIKTTALQTSLVENKKRKRLKFQILASNQKFQEETIASFTQKQE